MGTIWSVIYTTDMSYSRSLLNSQLYATHDDLLGISSSIAASSTDLVIVYKKRISKSYGCGGAGKISLKGNESPTGKGVTVSHSSNISSARSSLPSMILSSDSSVSSSTLQYVIHCHQFQLHHQL